MDATWQNPNRENRSRIQQQEQPNEEAQQQQSLEFPFQSFFSPDEFYYKNDNDDEEQHYQLVHYDQPSPPRTRYV